MCMSTRAAEKQKQEMTRKTNYMCYKPLTKSFEKQNRWRQTVRLLWASFLLISYISVSFLPLCFRPFYSPSPHTIPSFTCPSYCRFHFVLSSPCPLFIWILSSYPGSYQVYGLRDFRLPSWSSWVLGYYAK